jgi:hypothetical protein
LCYGRQPQANGALFEWAQHSLSFSQESSWQAVQPSAQLLADFSV